VPILFRPAGARAASLRWLRCANPLGPDEHDQIALAYGVNADRLQNVKPHFNPINGFSAHS